MFYTVESMEQAWKKVNNEIFPTDYEKDENSSERAGYPVYRSTAEGHYYDYICDLGDRLEVNLSNGESINVWVKPEQKDAEREESEAKFEVEVTTKKTGEVRKYELNEFIAQARFFWSSGEEHSIEAELMEMSDILKKLNNHGAAMEIIYGGLIIKVVYYRWARYDRFMKLVSK